MKAMQQITVCNFKGGVGKSTTAIHLSGFFQSHGPTVLIDLDPNPTSLTWSRAGKLPFLVVPDDENLKKKRLSTLIYDTSARPKKRSLKDIARDSNLVVVPTTVSTLALEGTVSTIQTLQDLDTPFLVVFVNVPPKSDKALQQARAALTEHTPFIAPMVVRKSSAYEQAAVEGCLVSQLKSARQRLYARDIQLLGEHLQQLIP